MIGRLGKLPARKPVVKPLRRYLCARGSLIAPPVPASVDRSSAVSAWPMLDNDTLGDCTIAAVGHVAQLMTAVAGSPIVMTDAEAIEGYEAFGYVPGNPSTDQGADAQAVLQRWCQPGFEIAGSPDLLAGFCVLDLAQRYELTAGVAHLGAVYAGIQLPIAMQGASAWTVPDGGYAGLGREWQPGSWGGHAVPIIGYDANWLTVVTWGSLLRMSWQFWASYGDEAYGVLNRDFASSAIPAEAWPALEQDMAELKDAEDG